jgi:hypothetical protein
VAGGKARRALDVAVLGGKFVTRGIAGSARSSFCPLGGRFVTRVALAAPRVTKCPPQLASARTRHDVVQIAPVSSGAATTA